jgi:hypothetical protein
MGTFSDFWEGVWRTPSQPPFFQQLRPEQAPSDAPQPIQLLPDEHYIALNLRALHIPYVRKGLKRFFGAAFCYGRLPGLATGDAEYQVFRVPAELRDLDANHVDRLLQLQSRLIGPTPYRGGDFEFQLALFTVESADMVAPFLDLLQTVSESIPSTYAAVTTAALATVRKGMDTFKAHAGPNSLEVGVHQTKFNPSAGVYLLASSLGTSKPEHLRLEEDGQILDKDGKRIAFPYIVFEIAATTQKDDWSNIPDISAAYRGIMDEIRKDSPMNVKAAQTQFERTVLLSADLIPGDAKRIVKLMRERVDSLQGAGLTAAKARIGELPKLKSLALYT